MNALNAKPKLSITGVVIQDPGGNGYTAYFAEFPEVIAQGDTEDEAIINAFDALKVIFDFRKEEYENEPEINAGITRKSFDLELA